MVSVINVECTKQDVIALSAIQSESYTLTTQELGRVPSEDTETDLGTKCPEQRHIERCMTKMGMMVVGVWAGERLLVVSGTGVITGEDCFEGHSWAMGVALRVTVGVGLLTHDNKYLHICETIVEGQRLLKPNIMESV